MINIITAPAKVFNTLSMFSFLSPLQCKAAYQSLLIADQHCRTRKYLLCLASGVPSVSHIWVRDCCKENKLLNYRNYLLPAGAGPDEAVVEW